MPPCSVTHIEGFRRGKSYKSTPAHFAYADGCLGIANPPTRHATGDSGVYRGTTGSWEREVVRAPSSEKISAPLLPRRHLRTRATNRVRLLAGPCALLRPASHNSPSTPTPPACGLTVLHRDDFPAAFSSMSIIELYALLAGFWS
ncbi:hypothetical protein MSAN_02447200 [Mycena sanguinolenta]|uniref:Uncharacterized protein n=1 Tax=Mycena sanguinolenta TaxID=230812 RepID=A0A8H7CAZ2_9AGAR|nr:hypothetical protein MSAN_02447200 [Mycena sanguinolenta]